MRYSSELYAKALFAVLDKKEIKEEEAAKNFIQLVRKNGDFDFLPKILEAVEKLETKRNGGKNIILEFARPLGEDVVKRFKEAFSPKDRVKILINKKILAGVRILVDGESELDYSLSRKLRKIFK